MSWALCFWILSFLLESALLGILMYTLICLSDLENDFINPHDSSARINKFVVPEYALHAAHTLMFLVTGRYFMFAINLPLVVYHGRQYTRKACFIDVTEIFNQLQAEKQQRLLKLGFYLVVFVITIYRLVESAVTVLLVTGSSRGGKRAAKKAAERLAAGVKKLL